MYASWPPARGLEPHAQLVAPRAGVPAVARKLAVDLQVEAVVPEVLARRAGADICDRERDGHVLTVTLNRPEQLNAFTGTMMLEMIEAFDEVANDKVAVEDCKVWLLKQKQTQDWKTTKATADAVYAL